MNRIVAIALMISLTGCATESCKKIGSRPIYNPETQMNDWEDVVECNKRTPWYEYALMPVFVLGAIAGGAVGLQRSVVESPHYQAGGSSYVDYTKP